MRSLTMSGRLLSPSSTRSKRSLNHASDSRRRWFSAPARSSPTRSARSRCRAMKLTIGISRAEFCASTSFAAFCTSLCSQLAFDAPEASQSTSSSRSRITASYPSDLAWRPRVARPLSTSTNWSRCCANALKCVRASASKSFARSLGSLDVDASAKRSWVHKPAATRFPHRASTAVGFIGAKNLSSPSCWSSPRASSKSASSAKRGGIGASGLFTRTHRTYSPKIAASSDFCPTM